MTKFPFISISGPPRDRGRMYGKLAQSSIERAVAVYSKSFEERGVAWTRAREIGEKFASRVKTYSQEMHSELVGIAEGSGCAVGEIVALNARTELLFSVTGGEFTDDMSGEGCTGAIALGCATSDGHVLHGQNWDWRRESDDISIMLRIEPEAGPTVLTLVEAGTLARCGLNSAGIAITGNFLKSESRFSPSGIPAPFVRRQVLMARNMHDAMLAVTTAERSFAINVMISDAGGDAIDFETTPSRLFWLRATNGILVHANHFASPGALAAVNDLSLQVTPDSLYRERRTREFLDEHHGQITLDTMKEIFQDRYGSPYGICREDDGTTDAVVSVATVLMDVSVRRMLVARRPYKDPSFETYSLSD